MAQQVEHLLVALEVIGSNLWLMLKWSLLLLINRHISLPCTVRTSQTNVVQLKGWLSIGRMDA